MGIKHLGPKSDEELKRALENLDPIDIIDMGVEMGNLELVKLAIQKGQDLKLDMRDNYFIKHAAFNGYWDIVKFLFEEGDYKIGLNNIKHIGFNTGFKNPYFSKYTKAEYTEFVQKNYALKLALEYAVEGNHIDVVRYLLTQGVPVTQGALSKAADKTNYKENILVLLKNTIKERLKNENKNAMKNFVNRSLDDFLNEKEKVPTTKKGKEKKFKKVLHHWKEGEQHIGKSDKTVPKTKKGQKQALAIAYKMSGQSKKD